MNKNALVHDSLSLVVPVFEEEELIAAFLRQTARELQQRAVLFEIIVVDDGSRDQTSNILRTLSDEIPQLVLIFLPTNTGIGHATIEGLKVCRYDIIFWNTVDRVIDTGLCLDQALHEFQQGYDLVTFYRSDLKAHSVYQRFLTLGNMWLIHLLYPWKFVAYQQFQFHRRAFFQHLQFESDSHFLGPELLFKARVKKLRIKELETVYHSRTKGKASGGRFVWVSKTFIDIIKFWFLWVVLKRPMKC